MRWLPLTLTVLLAVAQPACGDTPATGADEDGGAVADAMGADHAAAADGGGADPDAAALDAGPAEDAGPPPDPCTAPAQPPGDSVWTVTVGGVARQFKVHIPPSYDATVPTPLVVAFHGVNCTASQQIMISRLPEKADAAGFIAIHPEGVGKSWNGGTCCGDAFRQQVDDVGFTAAILDEAEAQLCIDRRRIFATGISNGAYMAHRLACEMADRVAAIAPVSGGNLMLTCQPARPIGVLYFHGTADTIVPYNGLLALPAALDTFHRWAQIDGCSGTPVQTFANGDSHCETYQTCGAGVEVTLCTIEGGGHQWPGGFEIPLLGHRTTDLSANDAMWDFFQRHPLP